MRKYRQQEPPSAQFYICRLIVNVLSPELCTWECTDILSVQHSNTLPVPVSGTLCMRVYIYPFCITLQHTMYLYAALCTWECTEILFEHHSNTLCTCMRHSVHESVHISILNTTPTHYLYLYAALCTWECTGTLPAEPAHSIRHFRIIEWIIQYLNKFENNLISFPSWHHKSSDLTNLTSFIVNMHKYCSFHAAE